MLVSVTDKSLLEKLLPLEKVGGIRTVSTGKTYSKLVELGFKLCALVETLTGVAEMMRGLVKTLNHRLLGGILADRKRPEDMELIAQNKLRRVDIVAVNLYGFTQSPSVANIDIGGVTLLRAAAKNAASIIVVFNPADYDEVVHALLNSENGTVSPELRQRLATEAFRYIANYDVAIATYLEAQLRNNNRVFEDQSTTH